jgi:hypothetical protein
MNHANDNRPRTPAEHRAIVASLSAGQDNAHEVRARNRNWPTFARLKRAKLWRQIQALERFAEDEGVSIPEGLMHAANDNRKPANDLGRAEIFRVDSRLGEENPTADEIKAAWDADENDRKEGRPKQATGIQFGAYGRVVGVKVRGRYRSLAEKFSEPRGTEDGKASVGAGFSIPDEEHKVQDEAARRLDHAAMKLRLGAETSKLIELSCGDATAEEVGEMYGTSGKTAERLGVKLVDAAIGKLMAEYARRDAADREVA